MKHFVFFIATLFFQSLFHGASQVTLRSKKYSVHEATKGGAHCLTLSHLRRIPLLGELRVHLPHPTSAEGSLPDLQLPFKSTPRIHTAPQAAQGPQQTRLRHILYSLPRFSCTGAKTFAMQLTNPNI